MRFAYIDSQGKEVSIPSVEALQLRIELGAITEDTRFYDASTDRWAPAGEHEIFRTLSRESGGRAEGGFVAPPPPTRGQKRPGAPGTAPGGASEGGGSTAPRESEAEDRSSDPDGSAPAGPPDAREEASPPAPPSRPRDPDPFEREQGPGEDEPSLDPFDLDIPVDRSGADEPSATDDFDFEGFGTIELDDSFTAQRDEEATESAEEVAEAAEVPDATEEDDDAPAMADDLELEPPLSEQPASSFMAEEDGGPTDEPAREAADAGPEDEADEPPAWMGDEDGGEAGRAPAASDDSRAPAREEEDRATRERGGRAPAPPPRRGGSGDDGPGRRGRRRIKPRPPPRRGKESNVGRIAAAVAAGIVLVVVGWYVLTLFDGGGEQAVGAVEPAVEVPELPSELVPTFERTGPQAYAATLDSLRALGSGLPEAPPPAWLGGNYLANASRFPGVRDYWRAARDYLDRIRANGEELFVSLYRAELDSAGVAPGGDRDALVDRARAGFRASEVDREAVYVQLEGLIDAAEGLDDFLRENEASIDYEPAAGGISRDPVVEAVPATEAMGEEMWDRVARITAAMDALGAVDRVRSELLLDILFEKLGRTTLY